MEYLKSRKLDELKAIEIVKELDKYIIGQDQADGPSRWRSATVRAANGLPERS